MRVEYPGLLTFELEKQEKVHLKFHVIEQAAKVTNHSKTGWAHMPVFKASNGWTVVSRTHPQTSPTSKTVYLRGCENVVWGTDDHLTKELRDKNFDAILQALDEWAASHGVCKFEERPHSTQLSLWD